MCCSRGSAADPASGGGLADRVARSFHAAVAAVWIGGGRVGFVSIVVPCARRRRHASCFFYTTTGRPVPVNMKIAAASQTCFNITAAHGHGDLPNDPIRHLGSVGDIVTFPNERVRGIAGLSAASPHSLA
jgi:hypothetical protein